MTKFIITIEGGSLVNIQSTQEVEYLLIDLDTKESDCLVQDQIITNKDYNETKDTFVKNKS